MKYWLNFKVTGSGRFPVDMLRRDNCWPDDQESVLEIIRDGSQGQVTVNLTMVALNKTHTPTLGRWESFGWRVDPKSLRYIKMD